MIKKVKNIPIPIMVIIVFLLLIPVFQTWNHGYIKARFENNCFNPRETLEDCHDSYYRKTAIAHGTRFALLLLEKRKLTDSVLATNCHQATHEIGRVAYKEYGSIGSAYTEADYTCWGGYLHGVVEASMRGRNIADVSASELRSMCSEVKGNDSKSFEYFSCVHGIGHALMFVSNNDLLTSLTHCDDLLNSWEIRQCANGAFMQNMFSNFNEHVSEFATKDDLHYPCNVVREDEQDICYQVQSKLIIDGLGGDFGKALQFCGELISSTSSKACASGVGAGVSIYSAYRPQRIVKLCSLAHGELVESCLYGALTNLEGVVGDTSLGEKVCSFVPAEKKQSCEVVLAQAHADFPGRVVNE